MAALALELCCTLMTDRKSSPNVGLAVRNKVLPQALTLIKSPLLQGQALLVTLSSDTKDYIWSKLMLGFKLCLLDISGFTKLFCCFSLFCKYKFRHFTGLAPFKCQASSTVRRCCKKGFAFNSSMCGCSLPCCRRSKMFIYCGHAYWDS